MYAPGTKSVIIAMLLVRSAPGVLPIWTRLTRLSVVEDCGFTLSGCAVTCTVCSTVATSRPKWMLGEAPELIVTSRVSVANPAALAVMTYWPTGTAVR